MMNLEDKKRNIEEIKSLEDKLAKYLIEHPELDSELDEEKHQWRNIRSLPGRLALKYGYY